MTRYLLVIYSLFTRYYSLFTRYLLVTPFLKLQVKLEIVLYMAFWVSQNIEWSWDYNTLLKAKLTRSKVSPQCKKYCNIFQLYLTWYGYFDHWPHSFEVTKSQLIKYVFPKAFCLSLIQNLRVCWHFYVLITVSIYYCFESKFASLIHTQTKPSVEIRIVPRKSLGRKDVGFSQKKANKVNFRSD